MLEGLLGLREAIAGNQPFFVKYFEHLIHSCEKSSKETQQRKLKIVVNYLVKFFDEKLLDRATLTSIWHVFAASFPESNKVFKDCQDIIQQALKSS